MKIPIKKIRAASVCVTLILTSLFSGCSNLLNKYRKAPELPDNAPSFEMYGDESADLMCIDYGGKTYAPFGVVKGKLNADSLRECLGYVDGDKNTRVYTLSEDPYEDYLVIINTEGIMEQPQFWRARSTYGEDIFTPDYIESLNYEEWMRSGCYYEMKEFRIDVSLDAQDVMELSMYFTINGDVSGSAGVRNADWSEMKDDIYDMSINEIYLHDKYDMDEPFDVEIHFMVTAMDNSQFDLEYVYTGKVLLGDKDTLTLTGNAADGYTIG